MSEEHKYIGDNRKVDMAEYFDLPNPKLMSQFGRIKAGNDEEYRTPFYGKQTPLSKIIEGWKPALDAIKTQWPGLYEYEMDQSAKVGPMSVMKPLSERMDDIDSYYSSILLEQSPVTEEAVTSVTKEWAQLRGLRIRGQKDTVMKMKKSTSSGSPFYTKKRLVVDKTIPCSVYPSGQDEVMQILDGDRWKAAAVLGWRGQEGGPSPEDVKQRVVWMFPFAVNVCELQFYQPMIERAQQYNLVSAWNGIEAVDKEITLLFDTKNRRDLIVCTDFSKFDQHFNAVMQDCVKRIWQSLLLPSAASSKWLNDVFPLKYEIPLIYESGIMRFGPHGMGSGSGGTNGDETPAHRALQYEAAQDNHKDLNPHSVCLGDDGAISFPGATAKKVILSYTRHGLEMNPSKQYESSQECIYLRRWHHCDYRKSGVCVGVYPTMRALGRLAEQERFYDPEKWNEKMVALRQLSILENVKWHPLREEFVDYCMKGDKYRLGLDIPGFFRDLTKVAREATDYMPDFLGYSRSLSGASQAAEGINSWWIVNYLKSKR